MSREVLHTKALTIQDWYLSANNRVRESRFNDGTVLTNVQAQALVGAMAAFNPSGAGIAMVQEGSTPGIPAWQFRHDMKWEYCSHFSNSTSSKSLLICDYSEMV